MSKTRIAHIRATPITVPLEAPLRHSNGAHWGRFVRTIVEVETDDGYLGLGEFGGGGEATTSAVTGMLTYLKGHDVLRLEALSRDGLSSTTCGWSHTGRPAYRRASLSGFVDEAA